MRTLDRPIKYLLEDNEPFSGGQTKFNTKFQSKSKEKEGSHKSKAERSQIKSAKNLNKMSFNKVQSQGNLHKPSLTIVSNNTRNQNQLNLHLDDYSKSYIIEKGYKPKLDHENTVESAYELTGNNTFIEPKFDSHINQDWSRNTQFVSHSSLQNNLTTLNKIINGKVELI